MVAETRMVTPTKGESIIRRHLRSRYPKAKKAIRTGQWHVYMQHVLVVSETTFSVQAAGWNGQPSPQRVDVDIMAGSCSCGANGPCAHLFAGMIWAQMTALDRAWRATHERVCRKRWCAGQAGLGLLCQPHQGELRRSTEWEELKELRTWRDLVNLNEKIREIKRGRHGDAA